MTLSASTVAKGASYCAALAGLADGTKQARYYATSDGSANSAAMDIVADVGELTFAANALSTATQGVTEGNPRRVGFTESWTVYMCWTIAYGTLDLITAVEFMNGRRPSDSGDTFRKNATKFDNIQGILAQAGPNYNEWTGDSAQAYGEANQQLASLMAMMKDADQQTAGIVQCQAGQVEDLAEELAAIKLALVGLLSFLSAASRYATNFNKKYVQHANDAGGRAVRNDNTDFETTEELQDHLRGVNDRAKDDYYTSCGISLWFADCMEYIDGPIDNWLPMITFVACCSAVTAATLCTLRATSDGFKNKDDIAATEGPARQYGTVALAATELINSLAPAGLGMRTANTKSVSGFWDLIALSDTQDAHPSAPTAAGTASGFGRHHAPVGVYARASDAHWGDRSAFPVSQTQAAEGPQTAPLAMSAPAQRHQSSGQAAAVQSENVVTQMNLGDREDKRMPSVPFVARQPGAAKKPVPAEPVFAHAVAVAGTDTDDADEAGVRATPGVADVQGVPAEVATASAKPARERSWADRNMW